MLHRGGGINSCLHTQRHAPGKWTQPNRNIGTMINLSEQETVGGLYDYNWDAIDIR